MAQEDTKVSIEKLRGRENYDTWKIATKSYLVIKNLWEIIENDIPPCKGHQ